MKADFAKGDGAVSKACAQEALEQAYDAYAERLKSFCRVRLGEAAEAADDCVQETFLVYYKRLLGGEAFLHPRSFLYKTANVMVCKAREEYFKNVKRSESQEKAEQLSVTMNAFDEADWDYDKLKALLLARLRAKLKGNYSGSKVLRFTVKPKPSSVKKVRAGKGFFTALWQKITSQISGYQLQYSTDAAFKNAKTANITKASATSKKIKNLKSKKKYYVRIRTYKTVNRKKLYSNWSKAKTVVTK